MILSSCTLGEKAGARRGERKERREIHMNAMHGGTGERPVGEEQKKTEAGGPLNVRNFQLLFGGQTISVIGDALYLVALPWLVLTTGGSPRSWELCWRRMAFPAR